MRRGLWARRTQKLAVIAIVVSAGVCVGSADAAALPAVPRGVGTPNVKVRPGVIVYTGDLGEFAGYGQAGRRPKVGRLRWDSWSMRRASATGGAWVVICSPDCARGLHISYRVTLSLYRPRILGGHLVFTRIRGVLTDYGRGFTMKLYYYVGGNDAHYEWGSIPVYPPRLPG